MKTSLVAIAVLALSATAGSAACSKSALNGNFISEQPAVTRHQLSFTHRRWKSDDRWRRDWRHCGDQVHQVRIELQGCGGGEDHQYIGSNYLHLAGHRVIGRHVRVIGETQPDHRQRAVRTASLAVAVLAHTLGLVAMSLVWAWRMQFSNCTAPARPLEARLDHSEAPGRLETEKCKMKRTMMAAAMLLLSFRGRRGGVLEGQHERSLVRLPWPKRPTICDERRGYRSAAAAASCG